MPATIHKLPAPVEVESKCLNFATTDEKGRRPDEVLFLRACRYFYSTAGEMVADDLIVRLVWEYSTIEPASWNEETFLIECLALYRLSKSNRWKSTRFARIIVQTIQDLAIGLFLQEYDH